VLDYLDIKVTSVRMPLFELGRAAMEALRRRIAGVQVANRQISEPIELIERASTATAPGAVTD
jgi:DNA-binding LacI/PurR family transcriptional regulator